MFSQEITPKNRILFIVDYSGSMQAMWGEEKKFEIARKVLFNLADSIQKTNSNVEIAIRVFGHQSHRTKNDCLDSKLEIDFAKSNAQEIKSKFEEIVAQGNTPIAYSLMEAAKDFSDDKTAINSIILITDGLENCEGNPCDAALDLKKKRVSINPYIIGLDIESNLIQDFECIGTFVNAKDEKTFTKVLDIAVKKVTKKTSVEINLLSKENKLISNTPITLYNHFTGEVVYNFIHALDKQGKADTIYLDPRGVFDIHVHTFPSLRKNKIELKAGEHNVINFSVIKGQLKFHYEKVYDDKKIDYILRDKNNIEIYYNQDVESKHFISNKYNLSVLTYPMVEEFSKNVPIEKSVHQFIKPNGRLVIDVKNKVLASLYTSKGEIVKDFGLIETRTDLKLQAGKYILVFIDKRTTQSERTEKKLIEIFEGKTVLIN
ncbi:MAG: vWA domain-containing protein [Chitinophagales bacterium]